VTLRQLLHQYLATAGEDALTPPSDRILVSPTEPIPQAQNPTLQEKQAKELQKGLAAKETKAPSMPTPLLEGIRITSSCPTPLSVRLPPEVGQQLGKCRLLERIGEGAYGIVFRAKHLTLDTDVAVKVLNLSHNKERGTRRHRFASEAKLLARITHPHLVRILDYEDDEQYPYLVLEFVAGESFSELLKRRGALPVAEAAPLIRQTIQALAAAHKAGIVHRDVKPANILISHDHHVKLTDLGMAAFIDPDLRRSSDDTVCGTVSYMAPEQFHKPHVDCRSDIYALGCTFFQAITGRLPYVGETPFEVMMHHVQEQVPLAHAVNPAVPPQVAELIMQMMAKYPEHRHQNYQELLGAFDHATRPILPPPAPTPGRRSLFGWLGWGKKS
jgi:serine/threonine protein kinase